MNNLKDSCVYNLIELKIFKNLETMNNILYE